MTDRFPFKIIYNSFFVKFVSVIAHIWWSCIFLYSGYLLLMFIFFLFEMLYVVQNTLKYVKSVADNSDIILPVYVCHNANIISHEEHNCPHQT